MSVINGATELDHRVVPWVTRYVGIEPARIGHLAGGGEAPACPAVILKAEEHIGEPGSARGLSYTVGRRDHSVGRDELRRTVCRAFLWRYKEELARPVERHLAHIAGRSPDRGWPHPLRLASAIGA